MLPRTLAPLMLLVCMLLAMPLPSFSQAESCANNSAEILRESYYSSLLGQQMFYTVVLPPCFELGQPLLPAVYLMHGSNEDDGHWVRLGAPQVLEELLAADQIPPLMLVLPFGNVIANRNRFDSISWANIFLTELVPNVEARYPVDPLRRAIGGISRGGFWALQIGLRHPNLFTAIGGHSAFLDRFHAPPDFNPLDLALNAPDIERLLLLIDRGKDDYAAPGLELMDERMRERGLDYLYVVHPEGQHNNDYWRQHVAEYLRFYASSWEPAHAPSPAVPPAFATNTPVPTPEVQAGEASGVDVFLPVAAFRSLRTSLSREELEAIRDGALGPDLILSEIVAAELRQHGVSLHERTRIVPHEQLSSALWADRGSFSLLPLKQVSRRERLLWLDNVPVVDELEDYPFAFSSLNPNYIPDHLTRITVSGVTALTRQTRAALDENGVEWAVSGIQDYVKRSDFFHISNEVSLLEGCPQSAGPLLGGNNSMCSKPEHFGVLEQLGVKIVELSGNHNNDYGYDAYNATLAYYAQQGMLVVGGGSTLAQARSPLILERESVSLGVLACNVPGPYYALVNEDPRLLGGVRPGAASCDWNWLQEAIPALATRVDVVLIGVQHWEFEQHTPTPEQRANYRRLIDLGADFVFGTAPHMPQTFEFYNDGVIHYGLGNLFFDQPWWAHSRFFMDTLYLYEGRFIGMELFPGLIEGRGRPRLMTVDEQRNFLFFMFTQQNGW